MAYSDLKSRLDASKFRSRFRLNDKDRAYIAAHGWDEITAQARKIVTERLAPALPQNDGKQTPMRGHVVFIAQHATATCCRGCLMKWHGIQPGIPLSESQVAYIVQFIIDWLKDRAGDLSRFPYTPTFL